MAVNRDELISCLNDLIQTCRDGEEGFRTAAEGIQNEALKTLFNEYSTQRAQFASELKLEVRQLGGDPERKGSTTGSFHRGWINIKSVFTSKNDSAIISECERGEDAAIANYQQVLKQNLPTHVMPVVKYQFTQIKQSHDRIRDLAKPRNLRGDNMNNKFLSFLAGCSTGALVALLFAPRSGHDLRETINEKVHEGYDAMSNKWEEGRRVMNEQGGIRGVVEKGVEAGKKVAGMGRNAVNEGIEQASNTLSDTYEAGKTRLNDAVEGAEERYRNPRRDVSGM
jgi:uncharacterized protein (TIGR02284 family)